MSTVRLQTDGDSVQKIGNTVQEKLADQSLAKENYRKL